MSEEMSAIWLTWEIQRRNRSLANAVGATLHEMIYSGNALVRYCLLVTRTMRLIRREKPHVIYYQNPSLILSALLATLKFLRFTRAKLVGDFHNAGVHPPIARFLVPWIVRNSDLVIVTNANLAPAIEAMDGHAPASRTDGAFEVLFICSWAPDEPIVEVLRAAQIIAPRQPGVVVSITGRPKLEKVGWTDPVPANVELTGFLAEADFESRLLGAAVVLDLTTRADCMVCGAYEAVSAQVPMVLSDNPPTRQYFRKGALFTDNSAASIAEELLAAHAHHAQMRADVVELKRDLLEEERATLRRLVDATRG